MGLGVSVAGAIRVGVGSAGLVTSGAFVAVAGGSVGAARASVGPGVGGVVGSTTGGLVGSAVEALVVVGSALSPPPQATTRTTMNKIVIDKRIVSLLMVNLIAMWLYSTAKLRILKERARYKKPVFRNVGQLQCRFASFVESDYDLSGIWCRSSPTSSNRGIQGLRDR